MLVGSSYYVCVIFGGLRELAFVFSKLLARSLQGFTDGFAEGFADFVLEGLLHGLVRQCGPQLYRYYYKDKHRTLTFHNVYFCESTNMYFRTMVCFEHWKLGFATI